MGLRVIYPVPQRNYNNCIAHLVHDDEIFLKHNDPTNTAILVINPRRSQDQKLAKFWPKNRLRDLITLTEALMRGERSKIPVLVVQRVLCNSDLSLRCRSGLRKGNEKCARFAHIKKRSQKNRLFGLLRVVSLPF